MHQLRRRAGLTAVRRGRTALSGHGPEVTEKHKYISCCAATLMRTVVRRSYRVRNVPIPTARESQFVNGAKGGDGLRIHTTRQPNAAPRVTVRCKNIRSPVSTTVPTVLRVRGSSLNQMD